MNSKELAKKLAKAEKEYDAYGDAIENARNLGFVPSELEENFENAEKEYLNLYSLFALKSEEELAYS